MNRRNLLTAIAGLPLASALRGQSSATGPPQNAGRLRAGLVAHSYRVALVAKTMTYEERLTNTSRICAERRRTTQRAGVGIYNAGTRVQLSQPTKELQDAQVDTIKKWVDVADKPGSSHGRVFGDSVAKGAINDQAIAWAVEVLKRGAEYAGSKGITLGVEDDGGLTAAEPTIAIAKQPGSQWAGINADSGNLPANGYARFESLPPYATRIHFKTTMTDPDGMKLPANWPRLPATIAASGYRGFVGLEYESDSAESEVPACCAKPRSLIAKQNAA